MPTTLRTRLRRLAPFGDAALTLLVLVVSLQPLFRDKGCSTCDPISAWGYALVVAQCLPLVVRRRWPFTVALVCGSLTGVYGVSDLPDPTVPYAALVAVYSVAAHATRFRANAAAVVGAISITLFLLVDPRADVEDITVNILVFTTAWLLGDGARRRRNEAREMADRAEQLERARAVEAEAAAVAERHRIAREMHDVVAHHLSMMVVQAEAGPVAMAGDPHKAEASFDAISDAGKEALTEMRRLLGVLKAGDQAPLVPQPGADSIGELVDGVRSAGVDARLHITGHVRAMPSAVDLSAYRVVQEALTNCIRHAGRARVDVDIRYDDDALRVTVVDDGEGGSTTPRPGGHGLAAMRERVSLVGGTLDVGPGPDSGWVVRAVLPLDGRGVR